MSLPPSFPPSLLPSFPPSLSLPQGYKARLTLLDKEENRQMESLVKRAKEIAQHAKKRGVHLMVDAEQTYLQPAIGHITVNLLMAEYNRSKPVIYNTIQCYRKVSMLSHTLPVMSCMPL